MPMQKKQKKNKGADQPVYPRSMINAFLIPYLDCMMSLVSMINTERNLERMGLTFTTLWTNSADDKLMTFFLVFPGNRI